MSQNNDHLTETIEKTISTSFGDKKVHVPKDLQSRENKMKQFFEGIEEPSQNNPNLKKKSDVESQYKQQAREMINLDYMWNGLLSYKTTLHAERQVLTYIKDLQTKMQWAYGGLFMCGFTVYSTLRAYNFTPRMRISGYFMSAFMGVIFAKLKMNQYAMELIPR
jgi:hypothetical protein